MQPAGQVQRVADSGKLYGPNGLSCSYLYKPLNRCCWEPGWVLPTLGLVAHTPRSTHICPTCCPPVTHVKVPYLTRATPRRRLRELVQLARAEAKQPKFQLTSAKEVGHVLFSVLKLPVPANAETKGK